MARVLIAPAAFDDLAALIRTHGLPADTAERVHRCLMPLRRFPEMGAPLGGRWEGHRFILGPWRWMVIVYRWLEGEDTVAVLTVQDGRSSSSPARAR